MCITGSEDAVTVQAGTFSWDRNEKSVLEKCVCVCACACVHAHVHTSMYESHHSTPSSLTVSI